MPRKLFVLLSILILPATLHAQSHHKVRPDYDSNPAADPARPTVTNPAHIPPPGYIQVEQGFVEAADSPDVNHQFSLVQTTKLALTHHILVQLGSQPFALTDGGKDTGDLVLGTQFLFNDVEEGHSKTPTIAIGLNHRVRSGTAPDLDIGSFSNSVLLLASGDLYGFHYDTNAIFNEQLNTDTPRTVRRAQFGQSMSVTHQLSKPLSITAELWHFTQPFVATARNGTPSLRSNAVGVLSNLAYTLRPNIVFDAGADRGLTHTSTTWEGFAGLTYLFPHRLWHGKK